MENKEYQIVDSVEKLEAALARVRAAQKKFAAYTQEEVDRIFLAAASAANKQRLAARQTCGERDRYGRSRG